MALIHTRYITPSIKKKLIMTHKFHQIKGKKPFQTTNSPIIAWLSMVFDPTKGVHPKHKNGV